MANVETIKSLVKELNKASAAYYNGEPIMSDTEFDVKLENLKTLEEESGIVLSNSPTNNVGTEAVDELPKVNHKRPMLSLDKCHTGLEIEKFSNGKELIASVKLDGISTRAIYRDGELISLSTRGNGVEGNEILIHKNSYENLPLHIDKPGTYIVDGETIIRWNDFDDINFKIKNEEDRFSHPRNLVAGTLMSLDSKISKGRHLRFVAWDVIEGDTGNSYINKINEAMYKGFTIVPLMPYYNESTLESIMSTARTMEYPCDGVVLKFNDIAYGDSLGRTDKFFRNGIAWKPQMECYKTTLRDIEWTATRSGKINPVAIFDPIDLGGAITTRATLNNVTYIKELELGIGDTIQVIRSNFVIPKIVGNETRGNTYKIPDVCPDCGHKAVIQKDNDSEFLMCKNDNCPGKLLSRLELFVSKEAMDIKGLGEKQLQTFIDKGWLKSIADIYKLNEHKKEIAGLDGFGSVSANKIIKAVEGSKRCSLSSFIRSLGIPLLGKKTSADLAKYCRNDMNEFINEICYETDFSNKIPGFGSEINKSIYRWFGDEDNINIFNVLVGNVIIEKEGSSSGDKLKGLTFVITGKLKQYANRDALVRAIEENGGKVAGSVSSKTSFLINNDVNSTSGKNAKAKQLGIKIITEEEFKEMIV